MPEVKIYVTTYCGYCVAAKRLLEAKGVAYQEIDCTRDPETRKWLIETTGMRTVPQIFIGGVPVGGYDDLAELDQEGRLDAILAGKETPAPV
jgi:glutaredoxin 3